MHRKCKVTRDGEVIGEHDEPTLLALLNAGALRLTDTYWHRGMSRPASLADFLCKSGSRSWLQRPSSLFLIGLPFVLAVTALLLGASIKPAASLPALEQTAKPAQEGWEIRRATPIIRGRFEVSADDDGPAFPQHTVEKLVAHSRVAVLALDAQNLPIRLGSGIAVDDGSSVLTSLSAVAGAKLLEVHLPNGDVVKPANVIIDKEIVVVKLPRPLVPVHWALAGLATGHSACVVHHPLGSLPTSSVRRIESVVAGAQHVHYALDEALPSSTSGSAVLNEAGDLAGILVDPANGLVLRAADARRVVQEGKASAVAALEAQHGEAVSWPVIASDVQVNDGNIAVTLRNQSPQMLQRIVLHLRCYTAPPEAAEVKMLEEKLRFVAVQNSLSGEGNSPEALSVRQALREVSSKLESAQKRLQSAVVEARKHLLRSEVQAIECELRPGAAQRILLDAQAATNWGADVSILEAAM